MNAIPENSATTADNPSPEKPAAPPPRRGPGHRGADVRDTVAEMAAKAQEISMEAGSKMAGAMKDVINAAAGLTGFVVESARDLVQYMVRRGQMTQEEADKLIREAEDHYSKKAPHAAPKLADSDAAAATKSASAKPAKKAETPKPPAAEKKEPAKPAAKKAEAKTDAKADAKTAAKPAPAAKKAAPAKPAAKTAQPAKPKKK